MFLCLGMLFACVPEVGWVWVAVGAWLGISGFVLNYCKLISPVFFSLTLHCLLLFSACLLIRVSFLYPTARHVNYFYTTLGRLRTCETLFFFSLFHCSKSK